MQKLNLQHIRTRNGWNAHCRNAFRKGIAIYLRATGIQQSRRQYNLSPVTGQIRRQHNSSPVTGQSRRQYNLSPVTGQSRQ